MGSVVNAVSNGIGSVVSGIEHTVSDVASGIEHTVSDVASGVEHTVGGIIQTVKDHPLEAAALAAAGFYFAPQIGAWIAADGSAVAGTAAGAEAGAASAVGTEMTAAEAQSLIAAEQAGGMTAAQANSMIAAEQAGAAGVGVGTGAAAGAAGAGAAAGGMSQYLLPGAIAGSSILGALAAKSAAGTQADAQASANNLQYKMWQEQQALQAPWRQTGVNALAKLNSGNILGDDPGYAFRLAEGQKSLDRQAAARGGLISGGALKAATKYGQDMGSQEYQNAFNRYATLAGYGQSSANALTNAAGTAGANIGAGITSAANANAAGTMGAVNALTSGVGQYLNYSSNQDLTNAIRQSAYTKAA